MIAERGMAYCIKTLGQRRSGVALTSSCTAFEKSGLTLLTHVLHVGSVSVAVPATSLFKMSVNSPLQQVSHPFL